MTYFPTRRFGGGVSDLACATYARMKSTIAFVINVPRLAQAILKARFKSGSIERFSLSSSSFAIHWTLNKSVIFATNEGLTE